VGIYNLTGGIIYGYFGHLSSPKNLLKTVLKAHKELFREIKRSIEGVSFDETPMVNLSANDLDLDTARRAFTGIRELFITV
jgi:hypothetical protein